MSRIALACAVMLASLFTVSAQADAAGFKRHKPYVAYHTVKKHKIYKAKRRIRALRHFRNRFVLKRHRHAKPYRFVRRYR